MVNVYFASDTDNFDSIWSKCLSEIGLRDLADATPRTLDTLRKQVDGARRGCTTHTAPELKTIYALLTVLASVIELQTLHSPGAISFESISEAVRRATSHVNMPHDVVRILDSVAPQLLASIFDVSTQISTRELASVTVSDRFFVEWRAPKQATTEVNHRDDRAIDRFLARWQRELRLIVDERSGEIFVKTDRKRNEKNSGSVSASIAKLQKRHRILLGLILTALRTSAPIRYVTIAGATYAGNVSLTPPVKDAIRRSLSDLNRRLGGVLKTIVNAERGMDMYTVAPKDFSYCWIRHTKDSSLLIKKL